MGLFSTVSGWLRPRAGAPGPGEDYWYRDIGAGTSGAGITVTPDSALKDSGTYACLKVLAETIATLPLAIFRELPGGGREAFPDHPLDEIIRFQPNETQTAIEFWETMVLHSASRGTGYAEIVPGRRGAVDQLLPLHPDRVKVERLPDGSLRFQVTDPKTGQRRFLLQEEVFRIPGLSSDGVTGLRAVDLAAEDIGLSMAADQYAARIFSQKLNFGGFLIHPGTINAEGQKNLIQSMLEKAACIGGFHRPMVLQEGMKFEKASMDAKEAQLLEARKWQIGEIARYWGIPLHMLDIDDQTNRSTVEEQSLNFVRYTLRPWVRRIEQAIRRDLILNPRRFVAKFNMDGLLRGNSAARADYFAKALGSGGHEPWMTPQEVRLIEGFNPTPNVGELRPPLNMQQLPEPPRALVDDTPRGRAERLVRKEVAAARKAMLRFAGSRDGFNAWVVAFYGGHVSAVMEILGIAKDPARVYCALQRDQLHGSEDIVTTLNDWQDRVPGEIVAALGSPAPELEMTA